MSVPRFRQNKPDVDRELARLLRDLPPAQRQEVLDGLDPRLVEAILYDWSIWAREKQREPDSIIEGLKSIWLILAGRGFGKSRTGSQTVIKWAEESPGCEIILVAPTASDARDVMIEGESGILNSSAPWFRPRWEPSKNRLTWPNGSRAFIVTADEPDRLRGKQSTYWWVDELASMSRAQEVWDNLLMGWRLGKQPKGIITTTPRPIPLIKELASRDDVHVTTGSTYENLENLAPSFRRNVIARYEGTRIGRQELHAEILSDVPGALWNRGMLDPLRRPLPDTLLRVVVGKDPKLTSTGEDEAGIIVVASAMCGCKGLGKEELHAFVLEDASLHDTPAACTRRAVEAYATWLADSIVVETNVGGDYVVDALRAVDATCVVKKVHAKRGKILRAGPAAALYEQGKVHHVTGRDFAKVEEQMCTFAGGQKDSPDRLDALVYALCELMLQGQMHVEPRAYVISA